MKTALMVYIKEIKVIFYRDGSASLVRFFGPLNTFAVPCTRILAQLEGKELQAEVNTKDPIEKVRFTHVGGPITVIWAD